MDHSGACCGHSERTSCAGRRKVRDRRTMSAGVTAGTQDTNTSVRARLHVRSSGITVCTLQVICVISVNEK
jgi:hypothetical protein